MNTRRFIVLSLCTALAFAFAIGLVIERQASGKLEQANRDLREQLSQMEGLIVENQRLSNLTARASISLPMTEDESRELLHLRSEIGVLREQSKEIETLQADTRQTRTELEDVRSTQTTRRGPRPNNGTGRKASQLEILKAEYWTANASMDVTDELQNRIRGDRLMMTAGNNIRGDPEFGQVKTLTIEYRFAGVTLTNEFREGDLVVLPGQ